jgi:saccharopine dehydrogenase-like NADP-dependent oxidoreductase
MALNNNNRIKIIVLGAGLVGGPMAIDLAKEPHFDVSAADIDPKVLEQLDAGAGIHTICKDLSNPEDITQLVKDYDLVVNAVPGHMGFRTLQAIIEAERNAVDIAFFPEDPFLLDSLAKEKNVTAITDCGVAPGMSNVLIGYIDQLLDKTEEVLIYVGGLPEKRVWPWEYKAVFSPVDVIEEYTRPARYVENGKLVTRPALSDAEFLDFPGVGTLEAFNSDGLRTLAKTIDAPNLKEKTLRYPGHIEKIAVLRETGFFSKEEISINGARVRPLDFTARLLFPKWHMDPDDRDITVLQVIIRGTKDGKPVSYTYDLLDRFDEAGQTNSMARTTGYTATVAVRMLTRGLFNRKGICPPEFIGKDSTCVEFMLKGLEERGIFYKLTMD